MRLLPWPLPGLPVCPIPPSQAVSRPLNSEIPFRSSESGLQNGTRLLPGSRGRVGLEDGPHRPRTRFTGWPWASRIALLSPTEAPVLLISPLKTSLQAHIPPEAAPPPFRCCLPPLISAQQQKSLIQITASIHQKPPAKRATTHTCGVLQEEHAPQASVNIITKESQELPLN